MIFNRPKYHTIVVAVVAAVLTLPVPALAQTAPAATSPSPTAPQPAPATPATDPAAAAPPRPPGPAPPATNPACRPRRSARCRFTCDRPGFEFARLRPQATAR